MPKALHPEPWTASDLRPDEDETKQLQPAHDATGSGLEPCPPVDPHDTPPYPPIASILVDESSKRGTIV
jgi:hypothetical protein